MLVRSMRPGRLSALDQVAWADRGIGVRGKQRELWEIPRPFRISDAGGDNAGLLIDFHVYLSGRISGAKGPRRHTVRTLCGGAPQAPRARHAGDLQLPRLHLHLRQEPLGQIPNSTEDPAGPHAGEVTEDQGNAATVHAPADPRAGEMAGAGPPWLLQLSRSADQCACTCRVPASCD